MTQDINVRQVTDRILMRLERNRRTLNATWDEVLGEVELCTGDGDSDNENFVQILNSRPGYEELFEAQRTEVKVENELVAGLKRYCDVRFIVDDGVVPIHGVFLCITERSKFLHRIIRDHLKLPCRDDIIVITLEGVKLKHLRIVLTLLYRGKTSYHLEDEKHIIELMKMLDLSDLNTSRQALDPGEKVMKISGLRLDEGCSPPPNAPSLGIGERREGRQEESGYQNIFLSPGPPSSVSLYRPSDLSRRSTPNKISELSNPLPEIKKVPPGTLHQNSQKQRKQGNVNGQQQHQETGNSKKNKDATKKNYRIVPFGSDSESDEERSSPPPPTSKYEQDIEYIPEIEETGDNDNSEDDDEDEHVDSTSIEGSGSDSISEVSDDKANQRPVTRSKAKAAAKRSPRRATRRSLKEPLQDGESSSDSTTYSSSSAETTNKIARRTRSKQVAHKQSKETLKKKKNRAKVTSGESSSEEEMEKVVNGRGKAKLKKPLKISSHESKTDSDDTSVPCSPPMESDQETGKKEAFETNKIGITKTSGLSPPTGDTNEGNGTSNQQIEEDKNSRSAYPRRRRQSRGGPNGQFICAFCEIDQNSFEDLAEHLDESCGKHIIGLYDLKNTFCTACSNSFRPRNYSEFTDHLKYCPDLAKKVKQKSLKTKTVTNKESAAAKPPTTITRENLTPLVGKKGGCEKPAALESMPFMLRRMPVVQVDRLSDENVTSIVDMVREKRDSPINRPKVSEVISYAVARPSIAPTDKRKSSASNVHNGASVSRALFKENESDSNNASAKEQEAGHTEAVDNTLATAPPPPRESSPIPSTSKQAMNKSVARKSTKRKYVDDNVATSEPQRDSTPTSVASNDEKNKTGGNASVVKIRITEGRDDIRLKLKESLKRFKDSRSQPQDRVNQVGAESGIPVDDAVEAQTQPTACDEGSKNLEDKSKASNEGGKSKSLQPSAEDQDTGPQNDLNNVSDLSQRPFEKNITVVPVNQNKPEKQNTTDKATGLVSPGLSVAPSVLDMPVAPVMEAVPRPLNTTSISRPSILRKPQTAIRSSRPVKYSVSAIRSPVTTLPTPQFAIRSARPLTTNITILPSPIVTLPSFTTSTIRHTPSNQSTPTNRSINQSQSTIQNQVISLRQPPPPATQSVLLINRVNNGQQGGINVSSVASEAPATSYNVVSVSGTLPTSAIISPITSHREVMPPPRFPPPRLILNTPIQSRYQPQPTSQSVGQPPVPSIAASSSSHATHQIMPHSQGAANSNLIAHSSLTNQYQYVPTSASTASGVSVHARGIFSGMERINASASTGRPDGNGRQTPYPSSNVSYHQQSWSQSILPHPDGSPLQSPSGNQTSTAEVSTVGRHVASDSSLQNRPSISVHHRPSHNYGLPVRPSLPTSSHRYTLPQAYPSTQQQQQPQFGHGNNYNNSNNSFVQYQAQQQQQIQSRVIAVTSHSTGFSQPGQPITCPYCSLLFQSRENLVAHIEIGLCNI